MCVSTALAVDVRDLAIHKENAILKPRRLPLLLLLLT